MLGNRLAVVMALITLIAGGTAAAQQLEPTKSQPKLVLAHYMPWFEAKPVSPHWGWHWTMNAYDPEKTSNGKRSIASHLYPMIGPYDSGDDRVIEYHILLMKVAGVDGVIVDWYGLQSHNDYALLHRNTTRLVEHLDRIGLKFAICYEDQTVTELIKAGRLRNDQRVDHVVREIEWLRENWFSKPSYVRVDGAPLLLSFGQSGLTDAEWSACLSKSKSRISYFSLHHRRSSAVGAFDWPLPKEGFSSIQRYYKDAANWQHAIPVAYPRFVDVYVDAKVGESYGRVEDQSGTFFSRTLELALKSSAQVVQIATWNDWGEGTVIEPSVEYGYRDLETIQKLKRQLVDPRFSFQSADLRTPGMLLKARNQGGDALRLDHVQKLISNGQVEAARAELKAFAD